MNNSTFELNNHISQNLGSTWLLDSIYLFIMSPLGFTGFVLNILVLFVLLPRVKQANHIRLFKYLIVYSLNSAVICFLLTFIFIHLSPAEYLGFTFTYVSKFYSCHILVYLTLGLCFFGYLLDIIILIDRLSLFLSYKISRLNQIKPFTKCFIILIICLFINSPLLFSMKIIESNNLHESNNTNDCNLATFSKKTEGHKVGIFLIFIRDIFALIFEITMTGLSIYYYKNFTSKSIHAYYFISNSHIHFAFRKAKPSKSNSRRLLLMSICLSIFSIISHLIISIVFYIPGEDFKLFQVMCIILVTSIIIKHILNAFIFYFFKNELKKIFSQFRR
jgi:hypothetical protein